MWQLWTCPLVYMINVKATIPTNDLSVPFDFSAPIDGSWERHYRAPSSRLYSSFLCFLRPNFWIRIHRISLSILSYAFTCYSFIIFTFYFPYFPNVCLCSRSPPPFFLFLSASFSYAYQFYLILSKFIFLEYFLYSSFQFFIFSLTAFLFVSYFVYLCQYKFVFIFLHLSTDGVLKLFFEGLKYRLHNNCGMQWISIR